jgi:hypothetical protein
VTGSPDLDQARAVADAVLFEGYLLYPYRATSSKNQARWQFGVLGPPGAAEAGVGEESTMSVDCLLEAGPAASLTIHIRFLQLQTRTAEAAEGNGFRRVDELVVGGQRWLSWDEAVEAERHVGPLDVRDLGTPTTFALTVPGGREIETLDDITGSAVGRLVRRRAELTADFTVAATEVDGLLRVSMTMSNTAAPRSDKAGAIATSFIGAHLLVEVQGGEFISTANAPDRALTAAAECRHQRWWPVLGGPPDQSRILLVSPIIVEDHAELAPESAGALFDSTEIDEILTLRVMTMTDAEKAEARATDPRAAEIIDRCDAMTAEQLQDLHGALRNPHGIGGPVDRFTLPDELAWATPASEPDHPVFDTEVPWWDPASDASVAPETDAVSIAGMQVSKGSLVTVRPHRRADAQDIFFTGMTGRVAAVLSDVDGDTHVAVTLVDDPAADMHEWYGRYLYFAPDELEPLPPGVEWPQTQEGDVP